MGTGKYLITTTPYLNYNFTNSVTKFIVDLTNPISQKIMFQVILHQ